VAAHQLAALGLLDILSSDYYPASLLDAAFRIANDADNGYDLPAAIALVTRNPARAIGLHDRGVIAEGKRADLVLVKQHNQQVYVRSVWAKGKAVY
jgi:alpha-D-ribose 1-methylphosphonate 5-triphosphate diphosphatase